MISLALALGIAMAPNAAPVAAFYPCHPDKHTACLRTAPSARKVAIPEGKRCHPDSTRSLGCVERLSTTADRRKEPGAANP